MRLPLDEHVLAGIDHGRDRTALVGGCERARDSGSFGLRIRLLAELREQHADEAALANQTRWLS